MDTEKDSISTGSISDTSSILNYSLSRFFEKFLEDNPKTLTRVAVKDADREDTQITFDELNKKANRLARCLVNRVGRFFRGMGKMYLFL